MNEKISNFTEMFSTGFIPNGNEFQCFISEIKKVILEIESKCFSGSDVTIKDYCYAYSEINKLEYSNGGFSHLNNLFKATLQDLDEEMTMDDLLEKSLASDDFYDLNNLNKETIDTSAMGSIDQMLMGMDESDNKESSFGMSTSLNNVSTLFENDLLKEYVNADKNLSSLIVLVSGYKRFNLITKVDKQLIRIVYSEYSDNKIGLNIYALEEDGSIKSCDNHNLFSILYYININDNQFARIVSPKKDGVDFINSSVYSIGDNNNKIADSLSSICAVRSQVNHYSEPTVKSFDFFVDGYNEDSISEYKYILESERGSFLFSGNKGNKKAGMITNKSVLKMMPPSFFGLTSFSTLELSRIIRNDKKLLEINSFEHLDLSKTLDINKSIGGYFMALDSVDMLEAYDFNINPFFGKYVSDHSIGLKIENKVETPDGFDNYITKTLTADDFELLNKYNNELNVSHTQLEYAIEEVSFTNEDNDNENNLLAKIKVQEVVKSVGDGMPLLNIDNENLNKCLSSLEATNHQMEYFIVDLRKFSIDNIRSVLNQIMTEVEYEKDTSFSIEKCGYCAINVTNEYKMNPVLKGIKQKTGIETIGVLRITFSYLEYLKKYQHTEDFNSFKLINAFSSFFEENKLFITSSIYEKGFNTVDLFFDNKVIETFESLLSEFNQFEDNKIIKLKKENNNE